MVVVVVAVSESAVIITTCQSAIEPAQAHTGTQGRETEPLEPVTYGATCLQSSALQEGETTQNWTIAALVNKGWAVAPAGTCTNLHGNSRDGR